MFYGTFIGMSFFLRNTEHLSPILGSKTGKNTSVACNDLMYVSESVYTYSRLSLSQIPRDSLKHFKISVPGHIRVERVRKTIN